MAFFKFFEEVKLLAPYQSFINFITEDDFL